MAFARTWSRATTKGSEAKRTSDSTMYLLLYFSIFLVLAGGIHSSPVQGRLSFEVQVSSKFQLLSVRFGGNVDINCRTNDPSANVKLERTHPTQSPDGTPSEDGKITRNGAIFTIHNIIVHDAGMYSCVAEKNGQVIKRDIMVVIDTRVPDIAIIPFVAKHVLTGSNVTYTCEATMGKIEWYKVVGPVPLLLPAAILVGVRVESSYDNKIVRKDLMIKKASGYHSGHYKCKMTHEGSSIEKIVQLKVSDPKAASISGSSSENILVDTDNLDDVELHCEANGFPQPKITWRKDGKVIENCHIHEACAQSKRYLVIHDGLMIVQPRHPDDDAVFTCEASNDYGSDSKVFTVIVPGPPKLDRSVKREFPWVRGKTKSVDINCELEEGSPLPDFNWSYKYCWSRYGSHCLPNWQSTKRIPVHQRQSFKVVSKGSKSTLEVTTDNLPSFLKFRCTATNNMGTDDMDFDLREIRIG